MPIGELMAMAMMTGMLILDHIYIYWGLEWEHGELLMPENGWDFTDRNACSDGVVASLMIDRSLGGFTLGIGLGRGFRFPSNDQYHHFLNFQCLHHGDKFLH